MSLVEFLTANYDKVFISADHHFGHAHLLELEPARGKRFKNVEDMDEQLITLWNAAVGPEDVVFHLGDFALTSKARMDYIISRLNGRLVLVMGNHDACRTRTFWRDRGFLYVTDKPVILNNIVFTHAPLPLGSPYKGLRNIHGHLHSRGGTDCMSVELTGYTPVRLSLMV
jgi:calcineurin-like phosphoesterase family protein